MGSLLRKQKNFRLTARDDQTIKAIAEQKGLTENEVILRLLAPRPEAATPRP